LKSFDVWVCIPSAKGELIRNRSLGAGSKFHRMTSNKSFADWGEVFNDQVLATAILDRLLHHATTVNIKGDSYRLREKKKAGLLGRKPRPVDAEEAAAPV
jgi:IstB-like ATP binding protein